MAIPSIFGKSAAAKVGKAVLRGTGKMLDGPATVAGGVVIGGFRAAGAVSRAVTQFEHAPRGFKDIRFIKPGAKATGQISKMPTQNKFLFGAAAAAGLGTAFTKGVLGTGRDALQSSGVSGSFLATNSLQRAHGEQNSSPRRNDPTLGDLTLNLGGSSQLNRSIKPK